MHSRVLAVCISVLTIHLSQSKPNQTSTLELFAKTANG